MNIEYFMESAYKALSVCNCVYYIHIETCIILPAFYFKSLTKS